MSLNFAHRGWSGLYPENTLLAFQKAIDLGVDGFEMDVQLSRDGEVVVFHDETLDRVTGYHGYLRDLTVSELKRLDASSGFRGLYGKNEIPTLREFLELVAPTELIVNMELKNNRQYYPQLEEKVIALVRAFGMEKRVIFSSFNNVSILRCRRLATEIDAGFRRLPRARYPPRPVDGELTARDPAPCGLGRLLHQHELPEPAQINRF